MKRTASSPSSRSAARSSDGEPAAPGSAPTEAYRSLDGLFRPRSVAVIGAARRKGSIGRELLHNLIKGDFQGKVFPVNPRAEVIHSIKAYPSVLAVPDEVDLAVIVVPRDDVLQAVEDCGRKGVKGVVVISSGFREIGPAGVERERKLMEIVRKHGMRMIGPNCMGIINTAPDVQLDATFSPTAPLRGPIAFLSQSGAMGAAILNHARGLGLGISMFASMGNKADVSGNDLMLYLEDDPDTKLFLLYLESFGNPRNFTRIARRIARKKPILAVKSGRTAEGAAAAASHTGALAGPDAAVDALLGQCGVLRANSIEELFDLAMAFTYQPLPAGNRVALLTDAGGPAIMAADAVRPSGLLLAKLSEETKAALREGLSPDASVSNPVDMLGHSGAEDFARCLKTLLADEGVDGVITLYVPPVMHDPLHVASCIFEAARGSPKPVLCVFMAQDEVLRKVLEMEGQRIPVFRFPESAVRAMGAMARYRAHRDRPVEETPVLDVDHDRANRILTAAAAAGRAVLTVEESRGVFESYGIRFAASRVAASRGDLRAKALEVGLPLVMKIQSPDVSHKTEVGGVATDLRTVAEVEEAWDSMMRRVAALDPKARIDGVLLQEMRRGAQEMILGVTTDPLFGPLLMAGAGGVLVEVAGDVAFRVCPVTPGDVDEMIAGLRSARLLAPFRGRPALCVAAYKDALLRLGLLVGDFRGVLEVDINPFMVGERAEDCTAVDARIRIDPQAF
jgi:acetyl coenzyme A synthetase (ADP forming)-like protein